MGMPCLYETTMTTLNNVQARQARQKPRRLVFACGTEFQVLVAYVMSRTQYVDCESVLLFLENNHRTNHLIERARASDAWSDVVSVSDNGDEFDIEFGSDSCDTTLVFFSWGFPVFNRIYRVVAARGGRIHLADEGLLTYQPRAAHAKWLAMHDDHRRICEGYDYDAVSEIWLVSPALFMETTHARLCAIDFKRFMDIVRQDARIFSDFCEVFGVGGSYSTELTEVIYFRQYFSAIGALAEKADSHLDREMLSVLSGLPVTVKDHPAYRNDRYAEPQKILRYGGPFEALLLAQQIRGENIPTLFVSPISSALINSAALGAKGTYVFLYKLLEQYCNWGGPDSTELLGRLRRNFIECAFFMPESWDEFAKIVNDWRCDNLPTASSGGMHGSRSWSHDLRAFNAFLLEDQGNIRALEAKAQEIDSLRRELEAMRVSPFWRQVPFFSLVGRMLKRGRQVLRQGVRRMLGLAGKLVLLGLVLPAALSTDGRRALAGLRRPGVLLLRMTQDPAAVRDRIEVIGAWPLRHLARVCYEIAMRIIKLGGLRATVRAARSRFIESGLSGLLAALRPAAPRALRPYEAFEFHFRADLAVRSAELATRVLVCGVSDKCAPTAGASAWMDALSALGVDAESHVWTCAPVGGGGALHTEQVQTSLARRLHQANARSSPYAAIIFAEAESACHLTSAVRRVHPNARVIIDVRTHDTSISDPVLADALQVADLVFAATPANTQWVHRSAPHVATVLGAVPCNRGTTALEVAHVLNAAGVLPLETYVAFCAAAAPAFTHAQDRIDVSIIIPVFNQWAMTRVCLNSLSLVLNASALRCEVILADDASTDETVTAAPSIAGLRILRAEQNRGFLRNCNSAAVQARGEYLLLLNNDTVVLPGWLEALHATLAGDPEAAICGPMILYEDGSIQEAGAGILADGSGVNFGRWLSRAGDEARGIQTDQTFGFTAEVDYISGTSILLRKTFWDSVGGFDERYQNAYCEDADLAMTARAKGFRVIYQPAARIVHFEHASYNASADATAQRLQVENTRRFVAKWLDTLGSDHLSAGPWYRVAAHAQRTATAATRERQRSGRLNVLYFSPFPSHPSSHGNQATIQSFARRFQESGHKVHFALLRSGMYSDDDANVMAQQWDTFDLLQNSHPLSAAGESIPFDGWYEDGLGERIRTLCACYDIDVVFCSYVFQSKLLEFVPEHILKVIDTHDKMGGRYDMLRSRGQPLEFFSCTPEEEGRYLRRADIVVARRAEEAHYFDSVSGCESAIVIPHVEDPHFLTTSFGVARRVGIVASANRINLAILQEFLAELDRQVQGRTCPLQIHVAGQVRDMIGALDAEQAAVFRRPWVQLHGFVEDIGAFYSQMDLIVSPVTMGTGINVKTVQAMAYGMPLLTTLVGIKGVETDEPMHRHADLASLVQTLLAIQDDPQVLSRLAEVSRKRYTGFHDEAMSNIAQLFSHPKLRAGAA